MNRLQSFRTQSKRFEFERLQRDVDTRFNCDCGEREANSLQMYISFPNAATFVSEAYVTIYASFEDAPKTVSYRWQREVCVQQWDPKEALFSWSQVRGRVHFAVFTHSEKLAAVCEIKMGSCVAKSLDLCQPWGIASLPSCHPDDLSTLDRWIKDNTLDLSMGLKHMLDEEGFTPLQRGAQHVGDHRVPITLLKIKKYIDANQQNPKTKANALIELVSNEAVGDPGSDKYRRGLNLLKSLLAKQWEVDVDAVDSEGNTALHKSAVLHVEGCEVVAQLIAAGANPNIRNLKDRTPYEEANEFEYMKNFLDLEDLRRCLFSGGAESESVNNLGTNRWDASPILKVRTKNYSHQLSSQTQNIPICYDTRGNLLSDSLREIFEEADTARKGYLTEKEFRHYYGRLERFGIHLTNEEIDTELKDANIWSDGKMYFDEFSRVIIRMNGR